MTHPFRAKLPTPDPTPLHIVAALAIGLAVTLMSTGLLTKRAPEPQALPVWALNLELRK